MPGLGHGGKYQDGRGLGVWRGGEYVEHAVWDVSHPTDVDRPDGRVARPVAESSSSECLCAALASTATAPGVSR